MRDDFGHAQFLVRLSGGPSPGTRVVGEDIFPWPLPERLEHPAGDVAGYYSKVSESQLPPEVDDNEHVARGAEYEWISATNGS